MLSKGLADKGGITNKRGQFKRLLTSLLERLRCLLANMFLGLTGKSPSESCGSLYTQLVENLSPGDSIE